jgi:hypothetical protein
VTSNWGGWQTYQPETWTSGSRPAPTTPYVTDQFPNPTVGTGTGATSSGSGTTTGSSQSALDILTSWFQTYLGLGSSAEIVEIIKKAWQGGYSPADMDLFLPDIEKTQVFQQRFPGFQTAIKNGYLPGGIGSLGQYIQIEGQMRANLASWGLPAGFYDSPSDFGQWIANGVSPDEINHRAELAVTAAKQVDPTMRNLMARYYGLTTGDVASYFLDASRALPTLERQYNAAGVASWAERVGLDTSSASRFEDLVDKGVTISSASQGYGTVKTLTSGFGKIAGIWGENYSQSDAESDVFFNQNDKRRRIMAKEAAAFSGSSQGATGSAQRQSY